LNFFVEKKLKFEAEICKKKTIFHEEGNYEKTIFWGNFSKSFKELQKRCIIFYHYCLKKFQGMQLSVLKKGQNCHKDFKIPRFENEIFINFLVLKNSFLLKPII